MLILIAVLLLSYGMVLVVIVATVGDAPFVSTEHKLHNTAPKDMSEEWWEAWDKDEGF